jgi:hypothetical protein
MVHRAGRSRHHLAREYLIEDFEGGYLRSQADGCFRGGRADPVESSGIIFGRNPSDHWINDYISSEHTDLQTVPRRDIEEMVGCPHAPCAGHISNNDVWVTGNVLAEMTGDESRA